MAKGLEYHWRKDSFDTLGQITNLIANGPHSHLYADYLNYLRLRSQGRRKESLAAANRFTTTYKDDPFEIRYQVCWTLIELTESHWDSWPAMDSWLFPANIGMKLMNPMFEEWRTREPRNVNAWIYALGFGSEWGTETAFLLEPHNPRCQYAELASVLPAIGYSTHELDHCGFILDGREEFSEMINSLIAVTTAMGSNLSSDANSSLAWLQALMAVYAETKGDLRSELAARGIVEPETCQFYNIKSWFKIPPDVGSH